MLFLLLQNQNVQERGELEKESVAFQIMNEATTALLSARAGRVCIYKSAMG